MSITNLQLITDALREINVLNEVETPSEEQANHSLRRLNQMLASWQDGEDEIDLGYFAQDTSTDTCPIPEWSELGVTVQLSIRLASTYGATVSTETAAAANKASLQILRKSLNEGTVGADMSHLPRGEGIYWRWGRILTGS